VNAPVNIGIVGCGDLTSRGVLPHLAEQDARAKMRVAAVCDIDADRARETAERFAIPHWHADCGRMLDEPSIDLALILTPTACHAEQAITAFERGKHVYLQKPMAATLDDARRVLAAAERSGRILMAAPVQHLCPLLGTLREIVDGGDLGTIFWCLTATHFPPTCEGSGFDRTWHYGPFGGPLRDRTLYSLTAITDVFGPVHKLTAMANRRIPVRTPAGSGAVTGPLDVQTEDNVVLLLEFASGVLAIATGNYCADGRAVPVGYIGVYGSHGSVETAEIDPDTWYPTRLELRKGGEVISFPGPLDAVPGLAGEHSRLPEAQVYADVVHLVDCLREGRKPEGDPQQAYHLVEVIERTYEAARTGATQHLLTGFERAPAKSIS
jgi:predicted dehydrogenase